MLVPSDSVCEHPRGNPTLWRYLTFTKFVQLLETSQFSFTRSDLFDDPFEGYWSPAGIRKVREEVAKLPQSSASENAISDLLLGPEKRRKRMYVSCWCANEHESAALWRLYLDTDQGVAIRTQWNRLASTLSSTSLRVRAGMVNYVDYERYPIPLNNAFGPFMFKRSSFEHEKEFRVLAWAGDIANRKQFKKPGAMIGFSVNIEELLDGVHVAPTAPPWFGDLVKRLLERYQININVVRSSLYDRPTV